MASATQLSVSMLLLAGIMGVGGGDTQKLDDEVALFTCPTWRGERGYIVDRDTVDIFVVLDFPRTHPEAVVAALIKIYERWQIPIDAPSSVLCLTLTHLLEVAAELRVQLPRERLLADLLQAQLRRIQKMSAGRPSVAAELYAAAVAVDPHISTYHLLLGSELAAIGNISAAAAAYSATISSLQNTQPAAGAAAERKHEMVRARLGLALALEKLQRRQEAGCPSVDTERRSGISAATPKPMHAARLAGKGDGKEGVAGMGNGNAVEQYQQLVSMDPDAHALWYLLARALRRQSDCNTKTGRQAAATREAVAARKAFKGVETSSPNDTAKDARDASSVAMGVACRLYASTTSRGRRSNGHVDDDVEEAEQEARAGRERGKSDSWEQVEYLRGSRSMEDALGRYGAWQLAHLEGVRDGGVAVEALRFLVFTPGPEGWGNRYACSCVLGTDLVVCRRHSCGV